MATGGSVPGRKGRNDDVSAEHFDVVCSPCKHKNRTKEAEKYCVDCQDYYCSNCVKVHEDVPAMSRHNILEKDDFNPTGGGQGLPMVPTERCDLHKTKLVDMYCGVHDTVCCHLCMSTEHGSCEVQYIPDNIKHLYKPSEMTSVLTDLTTTSDKLWHQLSIIEDTTEQLQNLETDAIDSVNELKQNLLLKIEELGHATIKDVKTWRNEAESKLHNSQYKLQQSLKQLESRHKRIEPQSADIHQNNAQRFVCIKQAKAELLFVPSKDTQCYVVPGIIFKPDDNFKPMMRDMTALGTLQADIVATPFTTESTLMHTEDTKPAPIRERMLLSVKRETPSRAAADIVQRSTNSLLQVRVSFAVYIRMKDDDKSMFVPGSCTSPDGTVLLADFNNKKLKRLVKSGSSLSLKDRVELQGSPWSICYISQQEFAVTQLDTKQIKFVSLGCTMKISRDIKLKHICCAMAYRDGELYVADNVTIYAYTTSGKPLRQLSVTDAYGQLVFQDIYDIVISDCGERIYVADNKKGLVAVNMQAQVLWTYDGPELKDAHGICVDGRGNVFVSGSMSHNVLQLSESGELLGEVVRNNDKYPYTVIFDRKHRRLITSWSDGRIVVHVLK